MRSAGDMQHLRKDNFEHRAGSSHARGAVLHEEQEFNFDTSSCFIPAGQITAKEFTNISVSGVSAVSMHFAEIGQKMYLAYILLVK